MTGLRQKLEYSETFLLGVPQVDTTGRPGTLNRRLLIFGKKYIWPKLAEFFAAVIKYLSSFSNALQTIVLANYLNLVYLTFL